MVPSRAGASGRGDGLSCDRKVFIQGIATFGGQPGGVPPDRAPTTAALAEQAGSFAEQVDHRRGSVRGSGHLTAQAADLLRGTVLALHSGGHPCVVLDLGGVGGADEAGLRALDTLRTPVAEDGGSLLVLRGPRGPAALNR